MTLPRKAPPHSVSGGMLGHLVRRIIHLSMIIYPWLYHTYGQIVANYLKMTPRELLVVILMLVLVVELIRFSLGITIFAQRPHEARQLSTLAWTALALVIVLVLLPYNFSLPVVMSCALVDPLLGELRHYEVSKLICIIVGLLTLIAVWLIASFIFKFAWWWFAVMAPIILIAEWINIKWVDDNFLMMFAPTIILYFSIHF